MLLYTRYIVELSELTGSMNPNQSAISRRGGFPRRVVAGSVDTTAVFIPGVWICRCLDRFLIRGWDSVIP